MKIKIDLIDKTKIAEIISDKCLINEVQDALDIMAECSYNDLRNIVRLYSSKSLRDFIFESNKYGRINFVNSIEEAKDKLINQTKNS